MKKIKLTVLGLSLMVALCVAGLVSINQRAQGISSADGQQNNSQTNSNANSNSNKKNKKNKNSNTNVNTDANPNVNR